MFVASGIQHTMTIHHIVICGLPAQLYNIFPHYLINGKIFEDKLINIKCVLKISYPFGTRVLFYSNKSPT
jgi:hypothetical protein